MPPSRRKRCRNETRFNKTSKKCDSFNKKGLPCKYTGNRKRCQRSTRCNIRTGKCDTTTHALRMKRCQTGYRRNRVTKECAKYNRRVLIDEEEKELEEAEEEEAQGEMFQDNDPIGRVSSPKRGSMDSIASFLGEFSKSPIKSPSRKASSRKNSHT